MYDFGIPLDADIFAGRFGQSNHLLVVGKDFSYKTAKSARHSVLRHTRLQGSAETIALPIGIDHEGYLSDTGRRVQKIAGSADEFLVLARPGYCNKGDVSVMINITQVLRILERERLQPAEKAPLEWPVPFLFHPSNPEDPWPLDPFY